MSELETFRAETREWLEANCPMEMRDKSFHWEEAHEYYSSEDADLWRQRMAERGWIAPTWQDISAAFRRCAATVAA